MINQNFQFSITTSKTTNEVFAHVINPKNWWAGIFGETIEGESKKTNDEFSFRAGDGMHYSHQKLIELVPDKKIVWLVTESNLSYLKNTNEWAQTKICFDIEKIDYKTKITFTHLGLLPQIECYGSCSSAWTQYMENLSEYLQ
ncbi:SRPBCC family protein [Flavobacterium phycosphaerae]|uniref:SRPBCC family protein n=1 Tax=Flavobacterium phycosphaerae TaxID=2697515 RepID=UPI001389E80D|nr:SRPBCC domain-containing protein [Flavobacterium phycosphaerae]